MPVVTMIAGPNGSGKSTLTFHLMSRGIAFGEYLNADEIAKHMAGPAEEVAAGAQSEVRRRRERALREGRDVCFETVMSHNSHLEFLKVAKKVGFQVRLLFIATEDPIISEGRVANRVLHGGHDVPIDRIANRYHRSLANLPSAIRSADYSLIFDNSNVYDPFRTLAEIQQGHLRHLNVRRGQANGPVSAWDVPIWWLKILPMILGASHLEDGPIT